MIMTSVILQNGVNFIDLKYELQKSILTNIMGLNLFENVRKICEKEHKHFTSNILKNIEKELTGIDYDKIIEKENNLLNEIDKNLKNKNQEHYDLLKEKHIIEYKLNDDTMINIEKMMSEKKILEQKNLKLKEEMCVLNSNEKTKLEEDKNNYEKNIEQTQIIINELTKEIKKSSSDNNEKLKKEKVQLRENINLLNENINHLNKNINELNIKNNEILKTILINENEINKIKKEYENDKKNILKKINDKKILEKSMKLQKENNKELLKHIFSDTCECCKTNKIIHEQIGYLEKIIKLQKEIDTIKYDDNDISVIDEKLLLLGEYENNINEINVDKLKIESFENKLKYENKNMLLIEENINININNEAINNKIKDQKIILLNNKKQLDNLKEYEKIFNEYKKNLIRISECAKKKYR